MTQFNIHETKTHLSSLLEGVARGESFIIAKAGKPIAKVLPYDDNIVLKSRGGFLSAHQLQIPKNFDTMFQNEIIEMFYDMEDGK